MGTKHTRYLYEFKLKDELKDDDKFDLKETNYKATFIDNSRSIIKETNKRINYIGNIDNGKECVAKVYKNINRNITYTISDLIDDLTNLFKAKNLSIIYNKKFRNVTDFIHINYVDFYIGYTSKIDSKELKNLLMNKNSKNLNIDNINLIENYIDTKYFRLFVDEYCQVRYKDSKSIPLFMHWNWVETNGTYLICDLRGEITYEDELELSSPSLQSKDKIYGNSDNGVYSLITFLAEHKHTEHCKNLPWPDDKHIKIAKNLKSKYNSSETCDDCKKIYDEIISSTFNSNNNFFLFLFLFLIILFLILPVFIFKKYIKKVIKKLNEVPNDNLNRDLEENLNQNNKTSLTINKVNEQKYLSTNEDTDENSFASIDKMEPPLIG